MERVIWCRGRRAGSRAAAAAVALEVAAAVAEGCGCGGGGCCADALLLGLPLLLLPLLDVLLMPAAVDDIDSDVVGSSKPWAADMVSPCLPSLPSFVSFFLP